MIQEKNLAKTAAAICCDDTTRTDAMVEEWVTRLSKTGLSVVGVMQKPLTINARKISRCNATLECIGTEHSYAISQELGKGSRSCNLDTTVLEQAAYDIRAAINPDIDLVSVNRFGKQEAQGGGFRCVIERAMELHVPVLTIVQRQWHSAWQEYGGGVVTTLYDSDPALDNWLREAMQIRLEAA